MLGVIAAILTNLQSSQLCRSLYCPFGDISDRGFPASTFLRKTHGEGKPIGFSQGPLLLVWGSRAPSAIPGSAAGWESEHGTCLWRMLSQRVKGEWVKGPENSAAAREFSVNAAVDPRVEQPEISLTHCKGGTGKSDIVSSSIKKVGGLCVLQSACIVSDAGQVPLSRKCGKFSTHWGARTKRWHQPCGDGSFGSKCCG